MRKTIFTPAPRFGALLNQVMKAMVLFMLVAVTQQVQAQCALACNKATQVSLDENCEAEVTPSMILNANETICRNGRFGVTVSYHGKVIRTSPFVTCANIGQTLEVMIRDSVSGNSCWGEITVEDKLAPVIECGSDTLFCYQMPQYTGPKVTDNCSKAAFVREELPAPWGSAQYAEILDIAFGAGNYDDLQYSAISPADLFTCKYDVIWLEGGDVDGTDLQNFLNPAGIVLMEDWVRDGGRLFINASTNDLANPSTIDFGFGVSYNGTVFSDSGYVSDTDHPIFKGPYTPANGPWRGTRFGHGLVCPPGMNVLVENENGDPLLINETFGDGQVYFGSMTSSRFHTPRASSVNFFANILVDLDRAPTPTITKTLLDERVFPFGCASREFVKRIERDYQATDRYGNVSTVCTQTLYLRRFPQNAVVCPPEYTLANDSAVDCGDIENGVIPTLPNGAPTPEWAGVPTVDGIALWPPNDFYCNITITYEDIVLPKVGCVTKIMRMWEIDEWWCNTDIDIANCRQMIEIVDEEPPVITPLSDIQTTTRGGYECVADVLLPALEAEDVCGSVVRVDVRYPGGFMKEITGPTMIELPVGIHDVVYLAYDDCYNLDSTIIQVEVQDLTPPVAVCDRYTVVGLTYDSVAHVYAETFDDGTYDDCKIDSFAVKRMDDGANCGVVQDEFKSYIEFCCDDVDGPNIMVIFRVYDKSGNFNDCMVEVDVQDKILPHIYCPPNITVSCGYHYDPADLSASFGTVVEDKRNRQPIVLNDPNASADGPLIDGHAYDNCFVSVREDTAVNINQCNVGTITRTFSATDRNGTVTCTQTITFENFSPFDSTGITWPASFDTIGCIDPTDLTEEITGTPIFNEDECDLVGYSFEDHVFPFFNSQRACLKIIRKWKVIDWCDFTFDPLTGRYEYEVYEYEQVIKVNDEDDPFFVDVTPDTMFCSFDTTCIEGPAVLIATAGDSCTPASELRWEYKIDADNDGTYDIVDDGFGGTIDASGDYPFGDHRIKYVFEDRCGNKITTERLFSIINCKAPTPYCKNGIVVDLMPMDTNRDGTVDIGMIEIWASDLDLGSFGPCGNPVTLSFSADTNETNRTYDCDSVGQVNVEIWVTDRITGNQAFCRTFIVIQDNNDACSGNFNGGNVSGLVQTEDKQNVIDAAIDLAGSPFGAAMTNDQGTYAFPMMPFGGRYNVTPAKDDMHLEGISTKDLIILQRHLLNIKELDSPYKVIAADVNRDKEISVRDITELRKLILGVYGELPNNTSWRFVDADYVFPDKKDPFTPNFPEEYSIDNFASSMTDVDFTAVKVGDLDNSVDASGLNSNGTRSESTLAFETADQNLIQGSETVIEIKAQDLENITGYQFTMNFDAQIMDFVGIDAGIVNMTESNLGLTYLDEGMINVSWHDIAGVAISPEDVLFTVRFVALADALLSDVISINSRMTPAEAYTLDEAVMNVQLNFAGKTASDVSFRLYQNHPNPFNENTIIGFDLPEDGQVMLSIYDVTGKMVALYQLDGNKGYNSTEVLSTDLTSTGVLYYQLDTNGYTATRKMVVLQ